MQDYPLNDKCGGEDAIKTSAMKKKYQRFRS
jgi:hypothetical protein